MRYLLLICTDPSVEPYDPKEDNVDAWVAEMAGKGIRLSGERLARADRAVTVRKRNGKILRADGPFAETKERIGGFDVIECASLEEAIEVAAKHPMARFGVGIGNATSLPPMIAQSEFARGDVQRIVSLSVAIAQATYAFAPWTFGGGRSFDTPMMFGLAAAIQLAAIACLLARR